MRGDTIKWSLPVITVYVIRRDTFERCERRQRYVTETSEIRPCVATKRGRCRQSPLNVTRRDLRSFQRRLYSLSDKNIRRISMWVTQYLSKQLEASNTNHLTQGKYMKYVWGCILGETIGRRGYVPRYHRVRQVTF